MDRPHDKQLKAEGATQALLRLINTCNQGYDLTVSQDNIIQLLNDGASPNTATAHGYTLLHAAVVSCRTDIAQLLIHAGANINCKYYTGATPLTMAASSDRINYEIAKLLLQAGADIRAKMSGIDILSDAVLFGGPAKVQFFLNQNLNLDMESALHAAIAVGNNESCKLLLEAGADPHQKDEKGKTALDSAKNERRHRIIQLVNDHKSQKLR